MMPRPSAAPAAPTIRGAAVADDPWRERIATLEVQLSAARQTATRATQELATLRDRFDGMVTGIDALDESVRASLERVESTARDALSRAERPLPLQGLDVRIAEIESASQAARAAVAALRQELAENRRLDDARAARITSIEDRVNRVEDDARPVELRLLLDRLEARVLSSEREQASLRDRLDAIETRAREDSERMATALESSERALATALASTERVVASALVNSERALARAEELAEAQDELRAHANVDVLLPRMADLEALVIENGRTGARLAKEFDDLRAQQAVASATSSGVAIAPSGLRSISGIGPKIESKLRSAGIDEPSALAALSEDDRARLSRELGIKRDKLDAWCETARSG